MRYISTSGKYSTDLRGAVSDCVAPDGTLYLPERLPVIPRALFNNIEDMSLKEIAYIVATTLLGEDVEPARLKKIVDDTYIYNVPFRRLDDGTDVVELFEGPTLAFKDFSAQFVANFVKQDDSTPLPRVAIVATTGNTGAAVANAFAKHKGRHVVVLFPHRALSRSQLVQFTTLGPTVHAIEVSGDIDRCKNLVRQALEDESLKDIMHLVSMNTANYLRIVPKVAVFFYVYSRIKAKYGRNATFSPAIPCGNLSSLLSAVIAKRLGLPMARIIAGCNANDDLVRVLAGEISPEKVNHSSRPTLAKAMDSGYPTNLGRILNLYDGNIRKATEDIFATSIPDEEIAEIIRSCSSQGYLADPHTAVAIGAAMRAGDEGCSPHKVVFATAHPAKSLDVMTDITGRAIDLPLQLTRFMNRGASPVKMPPTYTALRKFLVTSIN